MASCDPSKSLSLPADIESIAGHPPAFFSSHPTEFYLAVQWLQCGGSSNIFLDCWAAEREER